MNDSQTVDTIVVPATETNFQKIFLGEKQWFGISINPKIVNEIKYIAVYRSKPISALTHWAKIKSVKLIGDVNKCIVEIEDPIQIGPFPGDKSVLLVGPRYTKVEKLLNAKNLIDVFKK